MKKARSRKKAANASMSISIACSEDDGTQVERVEKDTKRNKKSKTVVQKKAALPTDTPTLKAGLKEFAEQTAKVGIKAILDEFIQLKASTQAIGDKPKTAFDSHTDKNRYKDVFCIDATRVKLTFPEGSDDYIHANWVNGGDGLKKFICTQGPKENTIEDFWRMVWQEKVKLIVMLCNEMECGKKKCERYWPETAPLSFPCKLTVRTIKVDETEKKHMLTKLEIIHDDGTKHLVDHVQWLDWPDRGVPETTMMVFRLIQRMHANLPVIVHCSAGIGRTGTVVGIDMMYNKFDKGEKSTMNQVVRELRDARHGSVQTDVQYAYMHRVLIMFAVNKKLVSAADVEPFVNEYDKMLKDKGG